MAVSPLPSFGQSHPQRSNAWDDCDNPKISRYDYLWVIPKKKMENHHVKWISIGKTTNSWQYSMAMLVYQRKSGDDFFLADCSYPEMLMMQESIGISIKLQVTDLSESNHWGSVPFFAFLSRCLPLLISWLIGLIDTPEYSYDNH